MEFSKYLKILESMAVDSSSRSLCEAAADEMMSTDVGADTTINTYMINVGTEFRKMMLDMGKDITEYAVNEAFKKNSDYVFSAFEDGVSAKTVAAKLYGDALSVPPKASYVEPVHYTSSAEGESFEKHQFPMVAESVGSITDYVKKNAIGLAIAAALGAGGMAGVPKAFDAAKDVKHNIQEQIVKDDKEMQVVNQVAQWNLSGQNIGNKKGWRYVDYKDKPGIYGPHFNNVSLADLEHEQSPRTHEPLQIGWYVSGDGKQVFSTVTGKYFKLNKSFYDNNFARNDLGEAAGVGARYILPVNDCYDWDLDKYYGEGNW